MLIKVSHIDFSD